MKNVLYYGDNRLVLREHIAAECVDLVYLDPPFNSNAHYNVLFKTPEGAASEAQAGAFQDTWHWSEQAEMAYDELIAVGGPTAELVTALRGFLGTSDMMAYLANMAIRLHEMRRVLKPTGSLYLHCDANASHYLKILLDGIFGSENFRGEIIWRRTNAHNFKAKRFQRAHDTLLYYTKGKHFTFNVQYQPYSNAQLKRYKKDKNGRYYKAENLTFSTANKSRQFRWRGTKPPPHRSWGASLEQLEEWWASGRILTKKDGTPRMDGLIVYLDEMPGKPVDSVWTDIDRIPNTSAERIGYPTQKPIELLKRIIRASSNEGDVVLDPFCGCGTTVHAAQELGRTWIGIDVAHYAVGVIEDRLRRQFGENVQFSVVGRPMEIEGARDLAKRDKYQFQWWANWLVGVQNYREHRKGADGGVDGIIYFRNGPLGTGRVIVSVKGGDAIGPEMIRSLAGTVEREKAELGLFVCLAQPSTRMKKEAAAAGICKTAHGKFPRIQIATVEDLLQGRAPNLPPRYEVTPSEKAISRGRAKAREPQLEFTFSIRGDKSGTTYPAERYIGQLWERSNRMPSSNQAAG